MVIRERLLAMAELNLAGKIGQMEDGKINDYVQLLNSFSEIFSVQEEKIKTALEAKDYPSLGKQLSVVRDILEKIFADELAQDCTKQINGLGNVKHEKLEAYMAYLLKSLSMLSIDIQMTILENPIAERNRLSEKEFVENDKKPQDKKIILAVDDTAFFLTVLKAALQDIECKLICVTSGNDAMSFLERHTADLFLLDIEMPGMNGYELAAKIRERGQKAPLIFLTGNSKRENVAKAIDAGAIDFIVKPINKKEVFAKINKHISG
jgi:CheY-like chemotaxis protein